MYGEQYRECAFLCHSLKHKQHKKSECVCSLVHDYMYVYITLMSSEASAISSSELSHISVVVLMWGGGQGGGRPGEKGAGGVQEAGEEGAGSRIPKVAGSGRKREKLCNVAQYFAIEKMQRGGSQKIQGGNRD